MKLSIIILNYKTARLTIQCLKNVLAANLPETFEIIVIDNNSHDNLGQLLKEKYPSVKFIASPKNIGMGAGNNLGIRAACGEFILLLNADTVVLQDSIKKLLEFAPTQPQAGIIAPQILNPDRTIVDSCCRWPKFPTFIYRRTFLGQTKTGVKHLSHFLYKDINLSQPLPVDWIFGAAFLARQNALNQIGLFDENFFLFLEETDLCRRMWQQNWQVWYCPEAKIIHYPHRRTMGTGNLKDIFSRYTWIHLHSWLKYFWKYRPQPK